MDRTGSFWSVGLRSGDQASRKRRQNGLFPGAGLRRTEREMLKRPAMSLNCSEKFCEGFARLQRGELDGDAFEKMADDAAAHAAEANRRADGRAEIDIDGGP